jgi:1,4-dihydroxy-2-naphthoate octaprenyltransferase
MIEHDAQQPDINPPRVKSSMQEEEGELVDEPDQRGRDLQTLLRHEKARVVIIGVALLAIILSAVLFLFTRSIVPLFITIVVVPLFYRCVDVYLDKPEASAR